MMVYHKDPEMTLTEVSSDGKKDLAVNKVFFAFEK